MEGGNEVGGDETEARGGGGEMKGMEGGQARGVRVGQEGEGVSGGVKERREDGGGGGKGGKVRKGVRRKGAGVGSGESVGE